MIMLSIKPPFDMIAFVRKEVGKWKKDHFNLVSWTLERLYVLLLKLEYIRPVVLLIIAEHHHGQWRVLIVV